MTSERETFLARWARRKREAAPTARSEPEGAGTEDRLGEASDADGPSASPEEAAQPAPAPIDPASLPTIEGISAETDIRAFLQPGVPPDLSRAALRRAWAADPAIRDFVGLAENAQDFNAPDAIVGFGPLQASEQVMRMVDAVVGERPPTADNAAAACSGDPVADAAPHNALSKTQEHRPPGESEGAPVRQTKERAAAPQTDRDQQSNTRRRHGGALPA